MSGVNILDIAKKTNTPMIVFPDGHVKPIGKSKTLCTMVDFGAPVQPLWSNHEPTEFKNKAVRHHNPQNDLNKSQLEIQAKLEWATLVLFLSDPFCNTRISGKVQKLTTGEFIHHKVSKSVTYIVLNRKVKDIIENGISLIGASFWKAPKK